MSAVTMPAIAPARAVDAAQERIEAVDLARGIAVALMILSHGVNGLLRFEGFTDWGMVPVHLATKFSSPPLFIVLPLWARLLRPITVIGTDALMAFIFHITVIFLLFRDVLGYLHTVSYRYALSLTLLLIAAASLWIWGWQRLRGALRKVR